MCAVSGSCSGAAGNNCAEDTDLVQIPTSGADSPLPLPVSYSPPRPVADLSHVIVTSMHSIACLNVRVSACRVIEPKQQQREAESESTSARAIERSVSCSRLLH